MKLTELLNIENLNKQGIIHLLSLRDEFETKLLFAKADKVRKKYCGDEVHLRGIIEFSNHCDQHCLYCGLRLHNKNLPRYRMSKDEILNTARFIYKAGIRTIVLQSGEDSLYDCSEIESIIKEIKNELNVAITLSLGERSFEEYKIWKDAGADRYLLKHETANPKLYSIYHQGDDLENRLVHLRYLKSIGYQIGSGNIIGLPKQTLEDIADDLMLLKKLDVDMASISPFIPSPQTPYGNETKANVDLTLKGMATARIVLKDVHIPATTALGTLDEIGREKGLKVGANIIMPNYTPNPYRQNYQIYPDKKCISDDPLACGSCLTLMIELLGRQVGKTKGHSLKKVLA
ncbi:MAG: [FeFe] hydrogenase H-cluster radical SAM maturase HydE [Ignavibacteria bacterium]|nr:[FeFe] hydrogenase H-cluster radical SAM maturase HydE [Ignavibacteria bacterium]MBT8383362.1 [FeFe] hydrogenase H-cluster radical SAM maturase HydE [Ignavibacteria bacterium]MBT8390388.1 [FeFe] hydrogenase H-cluster radical SAM maturase HydE [Ignavibacteria bacterium]NNJ52738.1 [FeFe] hydrogenase H-cluster radical SAM maturase HydE [Ignavibacteriaceae bacterium]NNL21633.1 [FeFe] hydrogenase H-cluster radical SAM maturase HydE [Ignavibacteriaceae bacterium]